MQMRRVLTKILAASIVSAFALGAAPRAARASNAGPDPLAQGFANPPQSARPRVWWHWMNGNITKEGIKLDLEWMKRVGIGGLQNFDANLGTPQVVEHRLQFMTREWKDAFRYAAGLADGLGLEMAIAASPGWSETGGPWVKPQQAMKKLAWSATAVEPGQGRIVLPSPPATPGPFQDIPLNLNASSGDDGIAPFFVDTQVVAYRMPEDAARLDAPAAITSSSAGLDAAALSNGKLADTQYLLPGTDRQRAWIRYDYARRQTVRSVTIGMPGARGFGALPAPEAWLEASDDGANFRKVADLPANSSLVRSATFPAVTARSFRIMFQPGVGGRLGAGPGAPGSVAAHFPPSRPGYAVSEIGLYSEARVHHFAEKAGFSVVEDYYALATPSSPATSATSHEDVIDLTGRMRSDGTLDWVPPTGRWTVLRMGYSLTGHHNGPASPEATGLEADKLNATHIRDYLDTYLGMYADAAGPNLIGAHGARALLTDSIESGSQNWTEDMLAQFQERRGYDPRPWLPALTGALIDSAEASDRFLYDWRKTIAELFADQHYKQVAESAHARGLILYGEALEDRRPQLGDDMAMRRYTDIPMAAMWTWGPGESPRTTFFADDRGAASVAHIYGQNLVAAESMTSGGYPWAFSPRDLKPVADLELALGLTPAIRRGANQLEIKVANLWVNRLIGDAQPGAAKITFTTGPAYSADAPLRPSGLLGPVRLIGVASGKAGNVQRK